MDANEYALKMAPPDKALALLVRKAEWMGEGKSTAPTSAPVDEPVAGLPIAAAVAASEPAAALLPEPTLARPLPAASLAPSITLHQKFAKGLLTGECG